MSCKKILIQLDPDKQASSFDAVVAIDAGVDQLLQYHLVEPADVRELIYGAIFTRAVSDLKYTAVFVGGSNVTRAESLLQQVTETFFGPLRVSVLMDANGANTTAAAAVVCAQRHLKLPDTQAAVLAGTGPVGQRAALLLARAGSQVRVASRSRDRAQAVCDRISERVAAAPGAVTPVVIDSHDDTPGAIAECQLVIAAGAAGISLLSEAQRNAAGGLQVAIDLNAVPPPGIEGTQVTDRGEPRDGVICYGAIGVGSTKMKIHRAAIQQLFTTNDLVLDAEEVFEIGCREESSQ